VTTLKLEDLKQIASEDERAMLLGVAYGSTIELALEEEQDFREERERYDDQIFAGLVIPW
jgi:hypothetical protein